MNNVWQHMKNNKTEIFDPLLHMMSDYVSSFHNAELIILIQLKRSQSDGEEKQPDRDAEKVLKKVQNDVTVMHDKITPAKRFKKAGNPYRSWTGNDHVESPVQHSDVWRESVFERFSFEDNFEEVIMTAYTIQIEQPVPSRRVHRPSEKLIQNSLKLLF